MFEVNEDMVFYAFRYALGRRTYAVGTVSDYLIDNWHRLKPQTKEKMLEEIRDAIKHKRAGMDMDVKMWQRILLLEEAVVGKEGVTDVK